MPKKSKKLMTIILKKIFTSSEMSWRISMMFSGKMWLKMMFKVTKKQCFILSLKIHFWRSHRPFNFFRVKDHKFRKSPVISLSNSTWRQRGHLGSFKTFILSCCCTTISINCPSLFLAFDCCFHIGKAECFKNASRCPRFFKFFF